MANYSNDQLIAFFEQWQPKVQYFGIDIIPPGFFKFYKQGRELVKAEAAAKVAEAKAATRSIQWTAEEYDAVALGYMTYGKNGYKQAIEDFRLVSQRHSDNAVKLATYSCAHLDTKSDVEGMADYAQGLLDALNAIEEGRFKGTR